MLTISEHLYGMRNISQGIGTFYTCPTIIIMLSFANADVDVLRMYRIASFLGYHPI